MRKISKISLVAAVAVAGLSTANAQPLEEAIKNVEVSGSVVYRYDNFHNKDSAPAVRGNGDSGKNNYKVGLNLASKVNDYVKFNSRFLVADGSNGGFVGLGAGRSNTAGGPAGTAGSDANAEVTLSQAYFSLTAIPNTVVNIGKQGLTTPYTVAQDINGNEQNGTGILALTNIDAFTFGAGYFNNTNLDESFELNGQKGAGYGANGSGLVFAPGTGYSSTPATIDGGNDIYVVTAQADLDAVKLEAWYVGMQDTFNTYTLAATSSLELAENANLGLEARYVNLKLKQDAANAITGVPNTETKNDMFRLAVDGKFDIVNARLAFTKTGKKGGLTALDQDAKNTSLGWAITSNGAVDAKYWQAALGADILENLNFTVHYGNIKSKDNTTANAVSIENYKAQEVFGQLTYKMSKNLSTYLRYGTYKEKVYSTGAKAQDQNRGRIQVAYTF